MADQQPINPGEQPEDPTPQPQDTPSTPQPQGTPVAQNRPAGPPPGQQAPRPTGPGRPQPAPQQYQRGPAPQGRPPYGQRPPAGPPPRGAGAPPAGGPRQAPDPRKIKRSPLPLIIGLAALLIIALISIGGVIIAAVGAGSGGGFSMPFGERVALLEVEGVLGEGPGFGADTAWLSDQVRDWTSDDSVKAMVIRVNSPGGAVSATQDLVQAIEEFQAQGKLVYTSMGDVAASGGIYVAMASDKVFANSGTLTGSVGVIMNFWGYQDLVEKVGVEARTIKSGQFKDIGSGTRPMTESERALLEDMIDDVYEQFFDYVYEARRPAVHEMLAQQYGGEVSDDQVKAHIRQYADGRIFSGRQAMEYGFVDQLGTLQDTIDALIADTGLDPATRLVENRKKPVGLFGPAVQFMHGLKNKAPGNVAIEYRFSM